MSRWSASVGSISVAVIMVASELRHEREPHLDPKRVAAVAVERYHHEPARCTTETPVTGN